MLLLGGSLIPRGYDGYNSQRCGTTAFILTEGLALPTAVYIHILVHLCDLPLLPVWLVLQLLIMCLIPWTAYRPVRPAMTPFN